MVKSYKLPSWQCVWFNKHMKVECVYEFKNIYGMYVCMYMLQQLRKIDV